MAEGAQISAEVLIGPNRIQKLGSPDMLRAFSFPVHELHDNAEQPGALRAQSGRLPVSATCSGRMA